MSRLFAITLLWCLLTMPLSAQNTLTERDFRLRQPTAEDYVHIASEIPYTDLYNNDEPINRRAIIAEFQNVASDSATAKQLLDFFQEFNQGFSTFGHYSPDLNVREWHKDIVTRWLENHPSNLYITDNLWFLGYKIEFSRYDLDNDRRTDLLAYVQHNSGYRDYWVFKPDYSNDLGLSIDLLPIIHSDIHSSPSEQEWGGSKLIYIGHLNNDNVWDMAFITSAKRPASWTGASEKYLRVVSWASDNSRPIAHASISTESHEWLFENIDNDPDLEIIAFGESEDNWFCHFEEKMILDWDGVNYVKISDARTFDDSIYCAIRMADNAFRDQRYSAAITHYQTVIRHYHTIRDTEAWTMAEPFFMYAMERLFIAYVLAEDTENAWKTLSFLGQFEHPDYALAHAFLTSNLTDLKPFDVCRLASSTIRTLISEAPAALYDYRDLPMLGSTDDEFYGRYEQKKQHSGSIGCDFGEFAKNLLFETEFRTDISPLTQIQTLGLTLSHDVQGDINNDGIVDHVIWTEEYPSATLYLSNDAQYIASRVSFPRVEPERLRIVQLPQGNGNTWFVASNYGDFGCSLPDHYSDEVDVQSFRLIYLIDDILFDQDFPICLHYTENVIDVEINDEIILQEKEYYDDQWYRPVTYIWENEQKQYVKQIVETSPADDTTLPYHLLTDVRWAFNGGRYDEIIELLQDIDELDAEYIYYRAFAYEQLGMTDEAIADYVHIYLENPQSAWGMMASLHIEPVGD